MQNITLSPIIPHDKNLLLIKGCSALVMFISILVAIYLPIIIVTKFKKSTHSGASQILFQKWLGRLSCLAAGIFLSTGLMDIYPDVIVAVKEATDKLNLKIGFPLSSFFTLSGYLLILLIEQGCLIYKHKSNKKKKDTILKESLSSTTGSMDPIYNKDDSYINTFDSGVDQSNHNNENKTDWNEEEAHDHINHSHLEGLTASEEGVIDSTRVLGLMGAMSIHAIFEGIAIGTAPSSTKVYGLLTALSFHKLIVAASLGLNLVTVPQGVLSVCTKLVGAPLVFSFGTPIGVGLGCLVMMAQEHGATAFYMVKGALQGIACGTFLYVVFSEILPHELGHHSDHDERPSKLLCLIFGFIFVCLYILFVPGA